MTIAETQSKYSQHAWYSPWTVSNLFWLCKSNREKLTGLGRLQSWKFTQISDCNKICLSNF